MSRLVSASDAAALLADGGEVSFLDVREIVAFGAGHPLLATNLPLSAMELSVGALVPRPATRIVLTDGGEGLAGLAAERLERLGYTDVSVLEGGAPAWADAGEALFPEIEVPAKGFGAFAKRHGRPDFITPQALDDVLGSAREWLVLDSRPRHEYRTGHIPGAINAPGADLLRCYDDLVPDSTTGVVVNCMSGTRGILGGLSLRAAGVPNEVRVLFHGTRGWLLEGFELERETERFPEPVSPNAVAAARVRAARIAEAAGIPRIDRSTFEAWCAEGERTTYLFDVRTAEEYAAGHLAGARNAPEGTLIMSPERYFATLNARFVLVDDDTVRATVTALWLAQMGWGRVAVLADGLVGQRLETGPDPLPEIDLAAVPELSVAELVGRSAVAAPRIIDVGSSDAFVIGHVPGAVWCSRVGLEALLSQVPHDAPVVLTSEDGRLAALAADDLGHGRRRDLRCLAGGTAAWQATGRALETGDDGLASPRHDHWLASSERPGDTRRNVIDYLAWEESLLDDIEAGGRVPYRNLIWRGRL